MKKITIFNSCDTLIIISTCLIFMFPTIEASKETIVAVPNKGKWSWTSQALWKKKSSMHKEYYEVCDVSSSSEPSEWIRSDEFLVGDAKRIDVTVQYAVSKCSWAYCKEKLKLFVYKTDNNKAAVPEPWNSPGIYSLFGTTSPTNLTSGSLSRNLVNTETYSFLTDKIKPYYYLAIQYQGGCFNLYSASISYSVCPSLALPTGLIQLPRTIAPINSTVQVTGSCANNSQPSNNSIILYGICQANGEWSNQPISGECLCKAGFGKYPKGSGAFCDDCPSGTFQAKLSGKPCQSCPTNSVQGVEKTHCSCEKGFYRRRDEPKTDNCTSPPSKPIDNKLTTLDKNSASVQWSQPSKLGGRTDQYYIVECYKCNDRQTNCTGNCHGSQIIHSPPNSTQATIERLSPYTHYRFKVVAKNGVSELAEKDGQKPKFVLIPATTKEGLPGAPTISDIRVLSATAVEISWTLSKPNGVVTFYKVTYYPVEKEADKRSLNTTKTSVVIGGLARRTKYHFQVSAATSVGIGRPGNASQVVAQRVTNDDTAGLSQDQVIGVILGGVAAIALIVIIVIVLLYKRKRKRRSDSKLRLKDTECIPLDGHGMYIDPSTYGSPMEALKSNTIEISPNQLKLEKCIGGGEFADVYKGTYTKESIAETVAIKMLKPRSSAKNMEDFILEASIMGQFNHLNVIELKGVVTGGPESPMMIVTEFMENGSLDHFLKKRDGNLTVLQQVGIARGVADGMKYLSGINFIHRDLAARNILVADNMAAKVSDFGLSRELADSEDNPDSEYTTQGGKIPIRWTAPEAIRFRKFSTASDVWSYGILLWEIMSYGERPYWDWDNFQVMERVEQGYRLPGPMNCPKSIHNVMLDCWEKDKNSRPKFDAIVIQLDELIRSPEKITDQPASRYSVKGAQTNFGEVNSVEDWLGQLKMSQYVENFEKAGYVSLEQVKALRDDDLSGIGVTLIGHRNKLTKSIKALKNYTETTA